MSGRCLQRQAHASSRLARHSRPDSPNFSGRWHKATVGPSVALLRRVRPRLKRLSELWIPDYKFRATGVRGINESWSPIFYRSGEFETRSNSTFVNLPTS